MTAACAAALQFRFDGLLWLALFPAVMAGAYLYGAWEEQTVAVALLIDLVVSYLVGFYDAGASRLEVLATDFLLLPLLSFVAARGRRWWPAWATASSC